MARFGQIDVLGFSPYAGLTMTAPKDVTLEALRPQIDSLLYGAVAAVQAVLPRMLEAQAGQRNWPSTSTTPWPNRAST
jgi:NAD(P)-dependent dehydrogenase (short-subunit alcohol dehydrogenase family)